MMYTAPDEMKLTRFCAGTLVHVELVPSEEVRAGGSDNPHLRWEIATAKQPVSWDDGLEDIKGDQGAWTIETDEGAWWWPCSGDVYVLGGEGQWEIRVWRAVVPPVSQHKEYWLTSVYDGAAVDIPRGHTVMRLLVGTLTIAGRLVDPGVILPASLAPISVATGHVQTGLILRGM